MNARQILKEWMLPVAMTAGASVYLIYHSLPCLHGLGPFLSDAVALIQPLFLFAMLFLTFSRIEPRDLKPHRWHWWLLLIQGGLFSILGVATCMILRLMPVESHDFTVLLESAMLCLICPTATAAAVVTRKLGGDVAGITTYTILINLLNAILIPLFVPLVRSEEGVGFWTAFSMIMAKVFPLLIMPCLSAWLVRYLFPRLHRRIVAKLDLAFYLWALALALAIAVTTRAILCSSLGPWLLLAIAAVSLICCVFQFALGRYVGYRYGGRRSTTVTAGQAMGQKNTVFAIWVGYTFMTPETSIVGGMYSIWHNLYNSWQLYRSGKTDKCI